MCLQLHDNIWHTRVFLIPASLLTHSCPLLLFMSYCIQQSNMQLERVLMNAVSTVKHDGVGIRMKWINHFFVISLIWCPNVSDARKRKRECLKHLYCQANLIQCLVLDSSHYPKTPSVRYESCLKRGVHLVNILSHTHLLR